MNENNSRRLPVYLVLDCSGSMTGEPIEAVRQGIKCLLSDLRNDPQALETVALSVITFDSHARQVSPLTDLGEFQEPCLTAQGGTSYGAALSVLMDRMNSEVKKGTPERKGDYRPLVFFLSDGQPGDDYQAVAAEFKRAKVGNVIACAAGPCADVTCLQKITESVVQLANLAPEQLRAFFKWVSASVKVTSTCIGQAPAGGVPVGLPAPPAGITIVP